MNTPPKSEGPEVAASEPSEPIAHQNEQENTMIAQRPDNPYPVDPTGPLTVGSIPDADLDRLLAATIQPVEDDPYTHKTPTWRSLAELLRVNQIEELEAEERDLAANFPDEDNRRLLIRWAAEMVQNNAALSADGVERLRLAIADTDPGMLTSSDVNALVGLISAALESDSDWARHIRADDAARMRLAEVRAQSTDDRTHKPASSLCGCCGGSKRVRVTTGRWNYTSPCPECDPAAFAAQEVDPDHRIIGGAP